MKKLVLLVLACAAVGFAVSYSGLAKINPDNRLRVLIIRHGEKPETGDHLSCQGQNRALLLPAVLFGKFNKPDHIYVPAMGVGKSNAHARMFETIVPFAVKYGLDVNSEFQVDGYAAIAERVLGKNGTVLMVWHHDAIPALAANLGVANPPKWKDKDFDSIWIITFASGKASLAIDHEALSPSQNCNF